MVSLGVAMGTVTRNQAIEGLENRLEEGRRRADATQRELQRTQEALARVRERRRRAEDERNQAETERRDADAARAAAEKQRDQAEHRYTGSQVKRMEADRMMKIAQHKQKEAEKAKVEADMRAAQAQAALEETERALKEGIRPVIMPTWEGLEVTKKHLHYMEGKFHFAVSGVSGSGKSSLINALRGVRNNDKGPLVARTNVIETTREIARFADPDTTKPFLWYDIPGAGNLDVSDWQYFNDQGLYIFDAIIVLIDNRFTRSDEAILRNCARFNIPAYIVRSKARQHIRNVLEDMAYEGDEEEDDGRTKMAKASEKYITETRASVANDLDRALLCQQKVYVVDKESIVQLVRGQDPQGILDERDLLNDLMSAAHARRAEPKKS